jgi:hypothetical protein
VAHRPPPPTTAAILRGLAALGLVLLCAGCGGGARTGAAWDGRRGYDGNGDYGYDLKASRSEASSYRARAARSYPAPGTPDDPWGPYVREAAARFQIPERWIRAVMRQESGGHQYGADGSPITSGAGAMGLMQVMPRTYDTLRQQYALGADPYDPHNNILAGAAYIRDMYAIYGAPGFLAAYNAGPDRLATYLAGNGSLPDETVNYLASVAPNLGSDVAMTGPLAVYAGTATASGAYTPPPSGPPSDAAYAGGGIVVQTADAAAPDDPADRAFDGGGLVTPESPTGVMTGGVTLASLPAPVPADRGVVTQSLIAPVALVTTAAAAPPPAPAATPTRPPPLLSPPRGGWAIQVGAFPDPAVSQAAIAQARRRAADLLAGTQPAVIPVQRDGTLYRARLVGLSAADASAACGRLAGAGMACFAVPPGF